MCIRDRLIGPPGVPGPVEGAVQVDRFLDAEVSVKVGPIWYDTGLCERGGEIRRHRMPQQPHAAGIGFEQAQQKPDGRSLAAAVGTQKAIERPARYPERQVLDREVLAGAIAESDSFD